MGPFTGRKQNHLRTGAKYRVMGLDRTRGNNKGASKANSQNTQFATKRDAEAYARSRSRAHDDKAYAVIDTSGYKFAVKKVYTHGKENKSLTTGVQDAYKGPNNKDDYSTDLKLLK